MYPKELYREGQVTFYRSGLINKTAFLLQRKVVAIRLYYCLMVVGGEADELPFTCGTHQKQL